MAEEVQTFMCVFLILFSIVLEVRNVDIWPFDLRRERIGTALTQ